MATETCRAGQWDVEAAGLARRLVKVMDSASRHLAEIEHYAPFLPDFGQGSLVRFEDKVAVEAALLLLVGHRLTPWRHELSAPADRLAAVLAPRLRSQRNLQLVMRHPAMAASLGLGHAILHSIGMPDDGFQQVFARAIDSAQAAAVERLPYRWMEFSWMRALGGDGPVAEHQHQIPGSTVGAHSHPLFLSGDDAYAITHALMFLGDFGCRRITELPKWPLTQTLEDIAAWQVADGNLDILSEALLGLAILDARPSPYIRHIFQVVLATWDELGFLPCPSFRGADFAARSGIQRKAYAFEHTYHTTFVAGMFCAVLLLRSLPEYPREPNDAETAVQENKMDRDALRAAAKAAMACPGANEPGEFEDPEEAQGNSAALDRLEAYLKSERPGQSYLPATALRSQSAVPEAARFISDSLLMLAAHDYRLDWLAQELCLRARLAEPLNATAVAALDYLLMQQLPDGSFVAHDDGATNHDPSGATIRFLAARAFAAVADHDNFSA